MLNIENIILEKYLENKIDDDHFIQLLESMNQSSDKILKDNYLVDKTQALTRRSTYDYEYERQKKSVKKYDDELAEIDNKIRESKKDKDYETVKELKKKKEKIKMLRKSEYYKLKYADENRNKMDKIVNQLGMSKYIRNRKY